MRAQKKVAKKIGGEGDTDGWRAYRRLGYGHRWVDHSKNYVDPSDRSLHTNQIEGLWNKFKKWLPQAENYNLEEYLYLFMWMEEQKQLGNDPFWALVVLVAADNSLVTLKESMSRQEKLEAEECGDGDSDESDDEEDEDEYEDTDEEDLELFHFFDCIVALDARQSFVRNDNFWSTSELVTTCSSLLFKNKNDNI